MKTVSVPNAIINNTNNNNTAVAATSSVAANIIPKTEPISVEDTTNNNIQQQFQIPNAAVLLAVPNSSGIELANTNNNKRPASLDLNKGAKKRLLGGPPHLLIDSPADTQNIKPLSTPDLEVLISNSLQQTPQPGTVFPSKVGGPITSEQEEFGKGFEEALYSLRTSKNTQAKINTSTSSTFATNTTATTTMTAVNNGMSGGTFTYTNIDNFPIKEENSTASPPHSPIDMVTQEKIKLERKRQRNRVAASKCRKRKLERISRLEDKVKILKGENTDLALVVKNLKDHVAQLKQQVMDHMDAGCNVTPIVTGTALLQAK